MNRQAGIAEALLACSGRFTAREISDATGLDATHIAAELARWTVSRRLTRHERTPACPRVTYEVRERAAVEALARGERLKPGQAYRTPRLPAPERPAVPAGRVVIEDCDFFVAHSGALQFIRRDDGELVHEFTPQGALKLCHFLNNVCPHIEAQIGEAT